MHRAVVASVVLVALASLPLAGATHPTFSAGDLVVSSGGGALHWYHPDGTLNMVIPTVCCYTDGLEFDSAGNLHVTGVFQNIVLMYDSTGSLIGTYPTNSLPTDIDFATNGDRVVTHNNDPTVLRADALGSPLPPRVLSGVGGYGGPYADLGSDDCTLHYTTIGAEIRRHDVCLGVELAPIPVAFAPVLKMLQLPDGTFLLAQDSVVSHVDSTGATLAVYPVASMSIVEKVPGAAQFWTSSYTTGLVQRIDMGSGAVLQTLFPGTGQVNGLAVVPGDADPDPPVPELGALPLALAGAALAGFVALRRRG